MSDPYLAAQETLRHYFYVYYGHELVIITNLVYGLGALNLVIIPAILAVRWKSGQFWLFRVHTIRTWKLVSPNPLIGWLISSLAFFAFALYYNHRTYQARTPGSDLRNYAFCITTPWLCIWLGGWIWAWAQAVAPFLSSPSAATSRSAHQYIPRLNPTLLTAFYPIVLVCCTSMMLTLSILTNIKFNKLFTIFKSLAVNLCAASSALKKDEAVAEGLQAMLLSEQEIFISTFDEFVNLWTAVWIGWVVIDALFALVFVQAVQLQIRFLRRAIGDLQPSHMAINDTSNLRHRQRLIWSYRSFLATTALIGITCALALGFSVPLAIKSVTTKGLRGAKITKILRLGSLTFTTILSTTINCLLLGLSIMNSRFTSSRKKLQYNASGRQFGTEETRTIVHLDVELRKKITEKAQLEANSP